MTSASAQPIVAITSADGHMPSLVATHLVRAGTSDKIKELRLLCNDKSKARHRAHHLVDQLNDGKVTLHEVNLTDLSTLSTVLAGITTLLLIPPGSASKFETATTILRAAEDAKVRNLVLLSWAGTNLTADLSGAPVAANDLGQLKLFKVLEDDVTTHAKIHGNKIVVRTAYFVDNLLTYAQSVVQEAKLPLPVRPDARIAPLDVDVLVACLAQLVLAVSSESDTSKLTGGNQTLTLTGPRLVTPVQIAHALGRTLGSPVEYLHVSMDEARKMLECAKPHWSGTEIEAMMETYVLWDKGELAQVSSDVELVFGEGGGQVELDKSLRRLAPEMERVAGRTM